MYPSNNYLVQVTVCPLLFLVMILFMSAESPTRVRHHTGALPSRHTGPSPLWSLPGMFLCSALVFLVLGLGCCPFRYSRLPLPFHSGLCSSETTWGWGVPWAPIWNEIPPPHGSVLIAERWHYGICWFFGVWPVSLPRMPASVRQRLCFAPLCLPNM